MQSALETAAATAARHGGARIHSIRLRIGSMSGVAPEALVAAFDALSPGTPAHGASLDIDNVRTICRCRDCETNFFPTDVIYACPACGQVSADIVQGRELELTSLEVS